jgi:hypothetical protein
MTNSIADVRSAGTIRLASARGRKAATARSYNHLSSAMMLFTPRTYMGKSPPLQELPNKAMVPTGLRPAAHRQGVGKMPGMLSGGRG